MRRARSALQLLPLGVRKLARCVTAGQLGAKFVHLWWAYRTAKLLDASGLFDSAWYARDPGTGASLLGASLHYVLRGAEEGRSPSPMFDGNWYLRQHREAAVSGLNPLLHYILAGRAAGLATRPALPGELPRAAVSDAAYRAWLAETDTLEATLKSDEQDAAAAEPSILVVAENERSACLERQDARYFKAFRGAGRADDRGAAVLFVANGARLAEHAVLAFQLALNRSPDAQMIYGDEDRLDAGGRRHAPWFKPDWDPDLALAANLAGPAVLFSRSLLERLAWDGYALDWATLRSFTLKASAWRCPIAHVARVVAHRLPCSDGAADADLAAADIRVVAADLASRGSSAAIKPADSAPGLHRVIYPLPIRAPLVSVIIPTRDHPRLLAKAADDLLHRTEYEKFELIIVDNGSVEASTRRVLSRLACDPRVRVMRIGGAFNWSRLNNQAISAAHGSVLVLLNNDIEVVQQGWLRELVAQAVRPEIGVAGAKLLYPNGTMQHAGIVVGPAGLSRHVFRGDDGAAIGSFGELAVTRSVAAVTGACLAIRRTVFAEVGGLEEDRLGVTNNDIDLCLKVRRAGYRVVLAANAVLVHREAASRGADSGPAQQARARLEREILTRYHGRLAESDPYLNSNLCILRNRPAFEIPSRAVQAWSELLRSRRLDSPAPWIYSQFRPDISAAS